MRSNHGWDGQRSRTTSTGPVRRRPSASLAFLVGVAGLVNLLAVSGFAAPPRGGSSSRRDRAEAIRSVPLQQMSAPVREKLQAVMSRPSIYRRLPTETIRCDPDMYVFLVRYPEIIVNMWEQLGVTKLGLQRTGDFSLSASDGAGTVSNVELVYGTRNLHVAFAEGHYEGPLFRRPIRGKCVLVLSSNYGQDEEQRAMVSSRLDVFLQLENVGADLLAKTLHPLVGRTADYNFTESSKFLSHVSRAAERNGPGVQRLAQRLTKVEPAVRTELARLADVVNQRETLRLANARPENSITDLVPDNSPGAQRR